MIAVYQQNKSKNEFSESKNIEKVGLHESNGPYVR